MNLPNIPDSLFKVLIVIGAAIIYSSILYKDKINFKYEMIEDKFYENEFELNDQAVLLENEKENVISIASELSSKYGVPNPISKEGSFIYFNKRFSKSKQMSFVNDSVGKCWRNYKLKEAQFNSKLNQQNLKKNIFEENKNDFILSLYFSYASIAIGITFLSIGYYKFSIYQAKKDKLFDHKIINSEFYKHCQSCGKKFTSILLRGTEADLTKCKSFCKECYVNGCFTEPTLTFEEFKKRCSSELEKRNLWKKRKLKKHLEKLDRWNEEKYL